MKPKISFKTALAIAKANGYEGDESLEAVRKWFDDNIVNSDKGKRLTGESVVKEVVVSVSATEGENVRVQDDSPQTEAADEPDEDEEDETAATSKSFRQTQNAAYRESGAAKHAANIGGGLTAKNHARIAKRKNYDRAAQKGTTEFAGGDQAELYGAYVKSVIGDRLRLDYEEKGYEADMLRKNGLTTSFGAGGALVPEAFEATLIKLREERGVAEQLVGVTNMASATETRPRRTSGVTVYVQSEGSAVTASNPNYDAVQLVAKDWMATSYLSVQLLNLSAIDIADETAEEHTFAMASKMDDVVFNGDGTSTYFGYNGFRNALKGLSGTIADIAGLTVASGNAYSEITADDLSAVEVNLPEYNTPSTAKWLMHKKLWGVSRDKMQDAGGTTAEMIANAMQRQAFGAEVVVSQVMPRVAANSQVCALFGYFPDAAKIGRVVGSMRFDVSQDEKFSQGLVAFRTMQQVAINIHDVGNASATASSREPGPVVGLITAAG